MYYNSIYSQLFNFIPRYRFEKIVKKSGGDRYYKHFTAWKQFLTLLFAQITGKDSLREIENALLANHKRLYYLGMEAVAKSTLSEAMNRRNPEIFQALLEEIPDRVMAVAPKHKFKFKNPLYAILQPLVPQSSLNKFNMVVLCRIAKISLFFPFYATEKNFQLKQNDRYSETIAKCPGKRCKKATFSTDF